MSIENVPDTKKAIDIIAQAGYLKLNTDDLNITIKDHNTINIQPKGNIFGLEVSTDSAIITFDTKKTRDPNETLNTKEILDSALEDYFETTN